MAYPIDSKVLEIVECIWDFDMSALVMLGEPGLAKTRLDAASSWPRFATTRPGLILTMLLVRLVFVARRPGPIRRRDWKPIAYNYLKNRNVILHIDRARAYKMHIPRRRKS